MMRIGEEKAEKGEEKNKKKREKEKDMTRMTKVPSDTHITNNHFNQLSQLNIDKPAFKPTHQMHIIYCTQ